MQASPETKANTDVSSHIHNLMHEGKYREAIDALNPIVSAIDTSKPTEDEVFALLMVADAQRFSGLVTDAYKNYVVASELDPTQAEKIGPHILKCLPEMQTILDAPVFETHLLQYLEDKNLQNRAVDVHATKLLVERFDLTNENAEVDFNEIICDQFLLSTLKHLVLANPFVESFFQMLRKEIFQLAIENGIPSVLSPIIIAMAEHAELVEYVMPISEDEQILLLGIQTLMETHIASNGDYKELLEPLLLFLMYEPITKSTVSKHLTDEQIQNWPETIQNLFQHIHTNPRKEARLAATIPTLANVEAEVSKKVMAQYQENPYPRWRDVFATHKKVPYLSIYPELSSRLPTNNNSKKLNCLVAGCGTGQQPIWLAANCKNVEVLAMDLSKPSIAYAMRQASALGHDKSIKFMQGDILDLDLLKKKFDVVQCSGVLHHMADPELGLQKVLAKLKDGGLLQLGLYSRIARDQLGINEIRASHPASTLDEIRAQRSKLLVDPTQPLLNSRDFYTASECRDLLNHVQEHQFDLAEIKNLLDRYGLTFLGFNNLDKEVKATYKQQYPADPALLSLDNWHEFEQKNPYIFKGMYQFHCQKSLSH